jgi:hypothetical protein
MRGQVREPAVRYVVVGVFIDYIPFGEMRLSGGLVVSGTGTNTFVCALGVGT